MASGKTCLTAIRRMRSCVVRPPHSPHRSLCSTANARQASRPGTRHNASVLPPRATQPGHQRTRLGSSSYKQLEQPMHPGRQDASTSRSRPSEGVELTLLHRLLHHAHAGLLLAEGTLPGLGWVPRVVQCTLQRGVPAGLLGRGQSRGDERERLPVLPEHHGHPPTSRPTTHPLRRDRHSHHGPRPPTGGYATCQCGHALTGACRPGCPVVPCNRRRRTSTGTHPSMRTCRSTVPPEIAS